MSNNVTSFVFEMELPMARMHGISGMTHGFMSSLALCYGVTFCVAARENASKRGQELGSPFSAISFRLAFFASHR
jgi:hypothetical protein